MTAALARKDEGAVMIPSPGDIAAFKTEFNISTKELGRRLGFNDDGRMVRGWLAGTRHGQPFTMAPPVAMSFWYLRACLRARRDGEALFGDRAMGHLDEVLEYEA